MTTKEAFQLGFLSRLSERGITPAQFEKQAENPLTSLIKGVGGTVSTAAGALGELASNLTPLAVAALVGVPAAAGVLTGWAHANLTDTNEADIERMKMQDFVDTYRSEARRIRRKLNRDSWRKTPGIRVPIEEY